VFHVAAGLAQLGHEPVWSTHVGAPRLLGVVRRPGVQHDGRTLATTRRAMAAPMAMRRLAPVTITTWSCNHAPAISR
jgi:hypothetical protein